MLFARLSRCLLRAPLFAALCAALLAGTGLAEPAQSAAQQEARQAGGARSATRVHLPSTRPHHLADQQKTAESPAPKSPAPPTSAETASAAPTAHAPRPARVILAGGELSVQANDSSLAQILHALASSSGMQIDGLAQDQRVFGTYGPGDPHQILSDLLDGAGYNVVMLGDTPAGAPRELILTARSGAPVSPPGPGAPSDQEEDEPVNTNVTIPETRYQPPMPQAEPAPNAANGVKTPQQLFQELEQMNRRRDEQSQQPQ